MIRQTETPVIVAPDVVFGIKGRTIGPSQLAVVIVVGVIPAKRHSLISLEHFTGFDASQPVIINRKVVQALCRCKLQIDMD